MAGSARVFISYSSKDTDIVDHLKAALADAGVSVWLDHEQLTPGTPNWEIKVREGITQATHLVYAASPDAAASPYVIHEMEMARGKGKTVLPFWIRGDNWYDCAPMGWYRAQYTDGRDDAYADGLMALLDIVEAQAPAAASQEPEAPVPDTSPARPVPSAADVVASRAALPDVPYLLGSRSFTSHNSGSPTFMAPEEYVPSFRLPDMPARLARLGFRHVTQNRTPVILPPLIEVPAGPFLMGTDLSREPVASRSETPQHRVDLAAFQIGKYPVTVVEYAMAVHAGAVPEPLERYHISWQKQLQRLDHPVVLVSWRGAMSYVTWLREMTGDPGWRLSTEAEWEKAARWDAQAGVSRTYPWGDSFDKHRCNTERSGIKTTTPVGSYPANNGRRSGTSPCGAEDMAGNVWELTGSLYKPYPYDASDGREDQESSESRAIRGGSWDSLAQGVRAASRGRFSLHEDDIGFRLAWSTPTGS